MSSVMLDRRRVLAALFALGVASTPLARAAAPGCVSLADGIDPAALRELVTQLESSSPQLASAETIGVLQKELSRPDALVRIQQRVTQDYERDRIVRLQDWRVSHTEAALYIALSRCT